MFYDEMIFAIKFTDKCNMRCSYCMVQGDGYANVDLPIELYDEFIRKLSGFRKVTIYAIGGEPLLLGTDYFREIKKIHDKYEELHNQSFNFMLNTNMTLFNDEWMELVEETGFGVIPKWDGHGHSEPVVIEKIEKYKDCLSAVNLMGIHYNIDDFETNMDELNRIGIKHVNVFPDIYLDYDNLMGLADKLINSKHQKIIAITKELRKLKRKTGAVRIPNLANVMNNDFTLLVDGTIRFGGPKPMYEIDNDLGNIKDVDHIIDIVFSDRMMEYNKGYIKSIHSSKDSMDTNAGGFFGDKLAIGVPLDEPNTKMVDYYKRILNNL